MIRVVVCDKRWPWDGAAGAGHRTAIMESPGDTISGVIDAWSKFVY